MAPPKPSRPLPPDGASEPREKPAAKSGAPDPRRSGFGLGTRLGTVRGRTVRILDQFGRWVALLAVLAAAIVLVLPGLFAQPRLYRVGDRVQEDVVAQASFPVVDQKKFDSKGEELVKNQSFYYVYDKQNFDTMARHVEDLFAEAARYHGGLTDEKGEDTGLKLVAWSGDRYKVFPPLKLARSVIAKSQSGELITALGQTFRALRKGVVDDLQDYGERFRLGPNRVQANSRPSDVSLDPKDLIEPTGIGDYLQGVFAQSGEAATALSADERDLAIELARHYVLPNLKYDPATTKRELDKQVADLTQNPPPETYKLYKKGRLLAQKDDLLTDQSAGLINHMQDAYAAMRMKKYLAIVFYIALLQALVFYYIRLFRPDITFTAANVLLLALPVLIALAFGSVALTVVDPARFPDAAAYAFPSAIVGMLCVILLDSRSAVLLVTIASLAFSVRAGLDFKVFLVSLFGGYVSVTALTRVQERKEVLKAGLIVGLINAATILLIHLIDDPRTLRWDLLGWGVGNGLACGIVTMPALVVFERIFGVVTDVGLLEITGLDHPLLQELEEKVPGSFQHSLNVCKLAEAAAKAVGANYLLVRAGAYYHDVGKISKPKYFSENQISLEDKSIHSRLSPNMSAMIIKNHVKAGTDLARRHGLPERVIDFIPQHHGTTIIAYFFHEAFRRFENSQTTDPVREEDFRYPGPKPQSIETAIVMLADTAEATVTSRFTSLTINEDELRMCVQKTITDKFADGQFDECDMTLRDLHEIRESFVRTLLTRFHHRVAYPTKPARSGPASPTARRDRMERE
jgi:putative nucleotidyltransferase with HDIG domain